MEVAIAIVLGAATGIANYWMGYREGRRRVLRQLRRLCVENFKPYDLELKRFAAYVESADRAGEVEQL